jgi:hypothetical protein
VLATVNTTPSISSTTPGSHCGTGSVTLGASATSGTISWYAAASGGSSLGTGTSFDTPSISSTTTYYVDATSNGCTTPSRTPVAATIKTIPTITSTTPASRNGTGTVTLGATASAGTINWYDAATGGTSLGTGTSFITPSISETTTYYVDATNNGCTTASRTAVTATVNPLNGVLWTAEGGSTAWDDPDNWTCNCIPQSTDDITIPTHPSGGDIYPAVNITDAVCKSLTISSGVSFSVSSGKNISIYGNFSNSGSSSLGAGTFTFSGSSAQTISGTNKFVNLTINNSAGVSLSGTTDITDILTLTSGTLTTNGKLTLDADLSKFAIISGDGTGSVSGNVNIQKQFPTYKRYYYISSPVTCNFSQLQSFVNITGWGASYKNGGWSNVWKYDETDISQITHPDGVWMNGWIAPSGSSEAMQPLKGYALYADAVKTTKLTLTGPVNSGQVNMSVTNTSSVGAGGHANDDGWMFVGNPYPCPIDWEATGGSWTKTNVDNAMYFFEFTTQYGGSYKSFVNGIGVPEDVTGIVAPMQGFFVHASGAGNLTVNNAARVNTTSTHFYKKTSAEKQMLRLKAYCKSTPDASDQTVIYFNNDATASYDNNFDAYKIMNNGEGYPNVYSMIDAENRLSINALPEVKENEETIPVGFKIAKNGNYIFNAAAIQNIPLTTDIYLIDMTANITQDLRTNPIYNFSASAGTTEGRFYLKFSPQTITNNYELPTTNSELINAFSTGNILNVAFSSSKSATASLHIYNLLGQDIMNPQQINSGNHTYTLEHGVYIVSIVTDSKTYTKKILIN